MASYEIFQHKTSLRADVIFSDAPPASMPNKAIPSQWSQAQINSSHRFFAKRDRQAMCINCGDITNFDAGHNFSQQVLFSSKVSVLYRPSRAAVVSNHCLNSRSSVDLSNRFWSSSRRRHTQRYRSATSFGRTTGLRRRLVPTQYRWSKFFDASASRSASKDAT